VYLSNSALSCSSCVPCSGRSATWPSRLSVKRMSFPTSRSCPSRS
jgi:hypothetical protein